MSRYIFFAFPQKYTCSYMHIYIKVYLHFLVAQWIFVDLLLAVQTFRSRIILPEYLKISTYNIYIIEYWLWASKESKNDINTWSTIVSILSESHQDLGVTETFFWTCDYPLWCNSCCGDTKIVYKCCLQVGNVAKDSGVVTTNISYLMNINKRQGTRCM